MAARREVLKANDFKKESVLNVKKRRRAIKPKKNVSKNEDIEDKLEEIDLEDPEFSKEDRLVSRLYREVVDVIMSSNSLRENQVDSAISEMKEEIHQGHRKGFRRFRRINFSKPANCCGYLRRYAICHTGLVKELIWNFFTSQDAFCDVARKEITTKNHLKIISLGGGPGNDLVGFCSALQEIPNSVKELDLYIVDVCKGWQPVFPAILRKAKDTDFGSFSRFLKKVKINIGFMEADLTAHGMFKNATLATTLKEVDLVLVVKVTSFLSDGEAGNLISVSYF